jgi:aspartate-semialdehyde dehydrogenase
MIETINKIRQNRDTNSSAVKDQKKIIENEIQELRTKIITHIDKLQEDLIKELTEAEKHVSNETRKLLASLDEKQKEQTEYQTNAVNIKKVCIRFTNIFSPEANGERRRNTGHVFTVTN